MANKVFSREELIEIKNALVHFSSFQSRMANIISNEGIARRHKLHADRVDELAEKVREMLKTTEK